MFPALACWVTNWQEEEANQEEAGSNNSRSRWKLNLRIPTTLSPPPPTTTMTTTKTTTQQATTRQHFTQVFFPPSANQPTRLLAEC